LFVHMLPYLNCTGYPMVYTLMNKNIKETYHRIRQLKREARRQSELLESHEHQRRTERRHTGDEKSCTNFFRHFRQADGSPVERQEPGACTGNEDDHEQQILDKETELTSMTYQQIDASHAERRQSLLINTTFPEEIN
jgi:hypothetical protein